MEYVIYGGCGLLSAIVSAKWALELNLSQSSQVIWGLGGLLFGPVAPLVLYIRLLRKSVGITD